MTKSIHLGFEVGAGTPVEIPLAHTFVTGQTQLSGKTTTLRAIVERSGQRALAFVTKRGEEFAGRRIPPYLPREGEKPIHWRLVETILASALGQRNMKWERFQIVNAAKGARSLADVRKNVERLQGKKGSGRNAEVYELLGEYLDLVLPEMRELAASDRLELEPGLNVMDLAGVGLQLQALVIRAALERINQHERGVLTVFPEAWEFAPRERSAPAKDEAIAMARKGAVLGNFLLCDSQDIAGVDTVIRQAASVWILGVQRELNELRRTIQTIPAGIKRPKPEDVAQLELGQFYACWGRHAIKVYVQPAWMNDAQAQQVATGALTVDLASKLSPRPQRSKEETVDREEAARLTRENEQLKAENRKYATERAELLRRIEALEKGQHEVSTKDRPSDRGGDSRRRPGAGYRDGAPASRAGDAGDLRGRGGDGSEGERAAPARGRPFTVEESFDNEALYQAIKARLIEELPSDPRVIEIVMARPELRVKVKRHVLEVDASTLRGRIARLIAEDFFASAHTSADVLDELLKRGADRPSNIELGNEMKALCDMGFFRRDNKWYSLVPGMVANVVEAEPV